MIFFLFHKLCYKKLKEACCIFLDPFHKEHKLQRLVRILNLVYKSKQKSCAFRSLIEKDLLMERRLIDLVFKNKSPVIFRFLISFAKISAQFVHSFSVHSFIHQK
jgi:hypothetical protein